MTTLITLSESLKAKKEAQDTQDTTLYERWEKLMKRYEDKSEEFERRLKMVADSQKQRSASRESEGADSR